MDEMPRRLVDDPALSSSLREDLARAGEAHRAYASGYDAASKAAALQAALATQSGGIAGTAGVKLALGLAAAAAFMGAGAALHARLQQHSHSPAQGSTLPALAAASPVPGSPPQPAIDDAAVSAPEPPPYIAPANRQKAAARTRATVSSRHAARHADPQHEHRQLARIRAHLQSGEANRAFELAERGQRELGESELWQEREALAVLALFELGRTQQAEQRSAALLARFPNSPFRAELEHRARQADER